MARQPERAGQDGQKLQKLTAKQELFVSYYLGECRHNATRAAEKAGYLDPDKAYRIMRHPAVAAEIRREQETIRRRGIACLLERVCGQLERHQALLRIVAERSEAMGTAGLDGVRVPGGATGLLVRQTRLVKVYEVPSFKAGDPCPQCEGDEGPPKLHRRRARGEEGEKGRLALLCPKCGEGWRAMESEEELQPTRRTMVVQDYALDTGLLRELRELENLVAMELGQRTNRVEHSGKLEHSGEGGKPIEVAVGISFEEALKALRAPVEGGR